MESVVNLCQKLNIVIVAEGVETAEERDCLANLGIDLLRGFLFARPAFKALAPIDPVAWPSY